MKYLLLLLALLAFTVNVKADTTLPELLLEAEEKGYSLKKVNAEQFSHNPKTNTVTNYWPFVAKSGWLLVGLEDEGCPIYVILPTPEEIAFGRLSEGELGMYPLNRPAQDILGDGAASLYLMANWDDPNDETETGQPIGEYLHSIEPLVVLGMSMCLSN